jgi:hypothetical protein
MSNYFGFPIAIPITEATALPRQHQWPYSDRPLADLLTTHRTERESMFHWHLPASGWQSAWLEPNLRHFDSRVRMK